MILNFFAGVEYNNYIFFSEFNNFNGLFMLDIRSNDIRFLQLFEREKLLPRLHRVAFLYKNEAWFIPQRAEFIAMLNLDTLETVYYNIPCNKRNKEKKDEEFCAYIRGRIIQERYLLLIPYDIDTAVIIDMEFHELYPFYDVINPGIDLMGDGVIINDNLFLLPLEGKFYIRINLKTNECKRIEWKMGEWVFGSIHLVDEKMWFSPLLNNYILCVDLTNGQCFRLLLPNPQDKYWDMMQIDDKLIFLPYQASNFLVVNKNNFKMQLILLEENKIIFSKHANIISEVASKDKKIITMGLNGGIVFWNKKIEVFSLEIDKKCFHEQLHRYLSKKGYLHKIIEKDIMILADMERMDRYTASKNLEYLVGLDEILKLLEHRHISKINMHGVVGEMIWHKVRK